MRSGKFKTPQNAANIDLRKPISGGPLDRGFDRWKGLICSSEMLLLEGNKVTGQLQHSLYEPLETPGIEALPVVALADFPNHRAAALSSEKRARISARRAA